MAWYADDTVGSGKTWATLDLFEAEYDGANLTGTDGVRARCTGVVYSGAYLNWSGWQAGQSSTVKIIITADTGQETDGIDETVGARITGKQNMAEATNPLFVDITNISLSETNASVLGFASGWVGGTVHVVKCLCTGGNNNISLIVAGGSTTTLNIGGSVFRDTGANYGTAIVCADADFTVKVINCTIADNVWFGLRRTAGSFEAVNVAAINNGTDFSGITETTCKSGDDGDITNNDADDFTAPSTNDYHVYDTNSALYQTGTTIADSWFTTLCPTDFDGTAWAGTPSVGAFEYPAAPEGIAIPVAQHHYNQMRI